MVILFLPCVNSIKIYKRNFESPNRNTEPFQELPHAHNLQRMFSSFSEKTSFISALVDCNIYSQ